MCGKATAQKRKSRYLPAVIDSGTLTARSVQGTKVFGGGSRPTNRIRAVIERGIHVTRNLTAIIDGKPLAVLSIKGVKY